MENTYLDMPSRMEEAFPEIENDILMELQQENPEYGELQAQAAAMKKQYPFITAIMEKSGEIHLSGEEHQVLQQYLRLTRQMEDMERLQIYFRGHTDAVAYLKKIKAI